MQHFFSYNATEDANGLRGRLISFIVHILLLMLFWINIFDMKPPEDPNAPPYVSLVQFIPAPEMKAYEDAGGSKGDPGMEAKEGGSNGEEKQNPIPEPETKVKETPVEELPKTVPAGPKPVITSSEPDVVTLPSPPKLPPITKPSPVITSEGKPTTTPTTIPTTPTRSGNSGSSGDDNTPGSGGSGTGNGTGQGSGDANSGNGSGAGGGSGTGGGGGTGGGSGAGTGSGTGDGVGVDFDAIGILNRQRESCVDAKKLAGPTVQKAVFNICINRDGYITYCSYNSKKSATRDMKFVRDAMSVAKSCKFKPNPAANKKECGTYTLSSTGIIQKMN
ncbi:MAG: hypothetical protein ABI851_10535 [Saprospiraceae bacterium]